MLAGQQQLLALAREQETGAVLLIVFLGGGNPLQSAQLHGFQHQAREIAPAHPGERQQAGGGFIVAAADEPEVSSGSSTHQERNDRSEQPGGHDYLLSGTKN